MRIPEDILPIENKSNQSTSFLSRLIGLGGSKESTMQEPVAGAQPGAQPDQEWKITKTLKSKLR